MKKQLTKFLMLLGVFLALGAGNASAWTVFYKNTNDTWTIPYIYSFNGSSGASSKDSGTAMSYDSNLKLWKYSEEGSDPGKVIFHPQSGWGGQTGNLTFKEGGIYEYSKDDNYTPFDNLKTLYLRGEFNNWGTNYALTTNDYVNYTLSNVTLEANKMFKVATSSWFDPCTYALDNQTLALNSDVTLSNVLKDNTGAKLSTKAENATVTYNINTHVIRISTTPTESTYALKASFIGNWGTTPFKKQADGTWQASYTVGTNGDFGIQKLSGTTQEDWIFGKSSYVTLDEALPCVVENEAKNNGYNFKIRKGTYTFTFNPDEMTLVVTGTPAEPQTPQNYYIVGTDPFGGWNNTPTSSNPKFEFIEERFDGTMVYAVDGFDIPTSTQFKVMKGSGLNNTFGFTDNNVKCPIDKEANLDGGNNVFGPEVNLKNAVVYLYDRGGKLAIKIMGIRQYDDSNDYVYLVGINNNNINGSDLRDEYKFTKINENQYALTLTVTGNQTIKIKTNNNLKGEYGNGGNGDLDMSGNSAMPLTPDGASGGGDLKLYVDGTRTISFMYYTKDGKPSLKIDGNYEVYQPAPLPEAMYLYGHIQGGSWDCGNWAKLDPVPGEPGVYANNRVVITGQWNQTDVNIDGARDLWGDTGAHCYVAFYTGINTKTGFDLDNSGVKKYGSPYGENNIDWNNDKEHNWNYLVTKNQWENYAYQEEHVMNNFLVKDGTYKVVFDFNRKQVLFTDPEGDDNGLSYIWFYGDDDDDDTYNANHAKEYETYEWADYYHSFPADNYNNVVQVGILNNPKHDAARQAEYTVLYRTLQQAKDFPNGDPSKKGAKRRADSTVAYPNNFDDATGKYEISGSSDFTHNHLLTLNEPGQYLIFAELADDAKTKVNGQYVSLTDHMGEVEPASLLATVRNGSVTYTVKGVGNNLKEPFSTTGTVILPQAVMFDQVVNAGDVVVTFKPLNNAQGWETGTNTAASYQKALSNSTNSKIDPEAGLYTQWEEIQAGASHVVDGFYNGASSFTGSLVESANADADYTYDVKVSIPCSGLYLMEFSAANTDVTLTTQNGASLTDNNVTIYPNLYGVFNNAKGFNINGYMWVQEEDNYVITLPEDAKTTGCVGFIPGTYFASSLTVENPTYGNYNSNYYAYRTEGMNLTDYISSAESVSNGKALQVKVAAEKNGASHDFIFYVVKGKVDDNNVSTGVETIGAEEEGEAIYYNLQGVRVENPENGLYIKVVNGRSTKVMINGK